ncbi:MAG: radical SAM family heme chaperone HemW [Deltaproteobacteria bacterium]|nr:radical SAM family heme chaperone HemW [Deltaproteobacteria bacterium]
MSVSVYVHFPYCLRKCPYCDFNSYGTGREDVPHEAYGDAVLRELAWRLPAVADRTLASIFFGGGTPSLWEPTQIGRVIDAIRSAFPSQRDDVEVTVECNPTSLDRARAAALREAGVGRVSVGVQSLDAERLAWLGRLHDAEGALRALREASLEMPRVSGDLMFGMPGQAPSAFLADLERVLETGVRHVSAYALTIEPGTQFGELHKKGRLPIATDDAYADTFLAIEERLGRAGLQHYEVSNYARPGEEARHNEHYWRGGAYVGVGAGAVGCVDDRASKVSERWRSEPLPSRYLETSGGDAVTTWRETLSPADRVREALMLGLRTRSGVSMTEVQERTGLDLREGRERAIERRTSRGELVIDGDVLRVPHAKWLSLDAIVTDLF